MTSYLFIPVECVNDELHHLNNSSLECELSQIFLMWKHDVGPVRLEEKYYTFNFNISQIQ